MKAQLYFVARVSVPAVLMLVSACSGTYRQNVQFNPAEPIRVAVFPFVSVNERNEIIDEEGRLLIDNLGLISTKQEETPAQIVRRQALNELEKTNLDLIVTALIDVDLPHHGFAREDGKIDIKKVYATSTKDICEKFLNCDAVLYGRINRWDRSYYGLESVSSVRIDFQLISAKDNKVLYSAQAEDSESRGITKGPTGWSSLVIEPIKGLDSDVIVDLSKTVVKKMIAPLNVKNRPVFLEAAPPSIFAVSHDASTSQLARNNPLVVVMLGSDHQLASFSIGSIIEQVPMIERSPGHYYGEYVALPTDSFDPQEVKVTLADKYGRRTEKLVSKENVSLAELR